MPQCDHYHSGPMQPTQLDTQLIQPSSTQLTELVGVCQCPRLWTLSHWIWTKSNSQLSCLLQFRKCVSSFLAAVMIYFSKPRSAVSAVNLWLHLSQKSASCSTCLTWETRSVMVLSFDSRNLVLWFEKPSPNRCVIYWWKIIERRYISISEIIGYLSK